jgi:hypothetical protein
MRLARLRRQMRGLRRQRSATRPHQRFFYHEVAGSTCVPRAMHFDLEAGVIGAASASPFDELLRSGSLVSRNAGAGDYWANAHCTKAGHERERIQLNPPPCSVAAL